MAVISISLLIFLAWLFYERDSLRRSRRRIPLLISVTGTRGKSTVARMLASALREAGMRVMAKTTGSDAVILMPDGRQVPVRRHRIASISEQIGLVRKAAKLGVDCLVAEVMSIHVENHRVESRQILRPDIVVITNVRLDHTEAMGESLEQIALVLAEDIPPDSTVFVQTRLLPMFTGTQAGIRAGRFIGVPEGASSTVRNAAPELAAREFAENLDLAVSVSRHMDIEDAQIVSGLLKATRDIGMFRVWKLRAPDRLRPVYLANGFAANDPESTRLVLDRLRQMLPSAAGNLVGILSLRADRGDRTLQWVEALNGRLLGSFSSLFVIGDHSAFLKRRLPFVTRVKAASAGRIMSVVMREIEGEAVIFGFGNMGGAGRMLVEHWNEIGDEYGL